MMENEHMILVLLLVITVAGCHKASGFTETDGAPDVDGDTDTDADGDTDGDTDTWPAGDCPEGFTCFADIVCDTNEDGAPDVDWTWLGVLGSLPGESRHLDEFTINDDGTASDDVTGFTWQRCTYSSAGGDTCPEGESLYSNDIAVGLCENTYGPGWRLPTGGELLTLMDFGKNYYAGTSPTWEEETFTFGYETGSGLKYWTGTGSPESNHGDERFVVDFASPGGSFGDSGRYLRCVQDWTVEDGSDVRYAVDPSATDEVMDLRTGLQWMRCQVGQEWTGAICEGDATMATFVEAESECEGDGWRLPTAVEALSIVNRCAFEPTANAAVFSGKSSTWTTTVLPHWDSETTVRVLVSMSYGSLGQSSNTESTTTFRCVK